MLDQATLLASAPVRAHVLNTAEPQAGICANADHAAKSLQMAVRRAIPEVQTREIAVARPPVNRRGRSQDRPFLLAGYRMPVPLPHLTPTYPFWLAIIGSSPAVVSSRRSIRKPLAKP